MLSIFNFSTPQRYDFLSGKENNVSVMVDLQTGVFRFFSEIGRRHAVFLTEQLMEIAVRSKSGDRPNIAD